MREWINFDNINYETIYNEWLKASKLIVYSKDINFSNLYAVKQMVQTYIEVKMKFLIFVKDVACMLFEHAGKNKKYCKNCCLTVEVSQ